MQAQTITKQSPSQRNPNTDPNPTVDGWGSHGGTESGALLSGSRGVGGKGQPVYI